MGPRQLARSLNKIQRQTIAVRLRARGLTLTEIAERVNASPKTIESDLISARAEARRYYQETTRQELAAQEAETLDEIQRLAFAEYRRSRRPARTRRTERDGTGAVVKEVETEEGRIGDSRLLAIAHKSVEQRRQLLGLDAPPASITDDDGQGADAVVVEVTARGEAQTIMRAGDAAIRVTVTAAEDRQPPAITVDGAVSGQPSAVSPQDTTPQGLPCPISAGEQPPDAPTTPKAPTGGDSAPDAPNLAGGAPASLDDRKQKRKRTPRKPK